MPDALVLIALIIAALGLVAVLWLVAATQAPASDMPTDPVVVMQANTYERGPK